MLQLEFELRPCLLYKPYFRVDSCRGDQFFSIKQAGELQTFVVIKSHDEIIQINNRQFANAPREI